MMLDSQRKSPTSSPPSQLMTKSEDVLIDRRGCFYLSHKTHGIHILRRKEIWPYQAV